MCICCMQAYTSAALTDLLGDLREEERVRDVVEDAVRRQHDHVTVLHSELVSEEKLPG